MTLAPDRLAPSTPARFAAPGATASCLAVYTASVFVSAFLLFSIQPMFTKMVLPQLGGTPAVWSVAMVFFQGLLLLGYLYAHLLNAFLGARAALSVHVCVLAAGLLACPIALATGSAAPPTDGEAAWLVSAFTLSVGLPFFAVSTNGPLLQAWFARSGHPQAAEPYFLYGASNLGSFSALLLYPVAIEPLLTLREQSWLWSVAYGAFILLIAACAVFAWRADWARPKRGSEGAATRPSALQRLRWVALAFVPSGLLVAVTAHISTDVATAPFLWVVPLALFLLTFVLVFRERALLPQRAMTVALPLLVAALLLIETFAQTVLPLMLGCNLLLLFGAAMVCHGELYRRRPAAIRLTEFYLFVSLGGVLGGVFTSLVAPRLFSDITEYPILILAALLCCPPTRGDSPRLMARQAASVLLVVALAYLVLRALPHAAITASIAPVVVGVFSALFAILWLERGRPVLIAGAAALCFVSLAAIDLRSSTVAMRSFFGVKKISLSPDGQFRFLFHGNIIHGGLRVANPDGSVPVGRPEPAIYYTVGSPLWQAVSAAREQAGGRLASVVVAGLGAGSTACFAQSGENWTFLEIDPQMVEIARDPNLFPYLRDCAPAARIVTGDARLTLAREQNRFGAIMLDAFSSDAIPLHLLTEEAMRAYLAKLDDAGVLILHISNRYLKLEPFVAALAQRLGLVGVVMTQRDSDLSDRQRKAHANGSQVVVLARRAEDLGALGTAWTRLAANPSVRVWTDDYSNILAAMLR